MEIVWWPIISLMFHKTRQIGLSVAKAQVARGRKGPGHGLVPLLRRSLSQAISRMRHTHPTLVMWRLPAALKIANQPRRGIHNQPTENQPEENDPSGAQIADEQKPL